MSQHRRIGFAALLLAGCASGGDERGAGEDTAAKVPALRTTSIARLARPAQPGDSHAHAPAAGVVIDLDAFALLGSNGPQPASAAAAGAETILLHYWATWCAPCVRELPRLDAYLAAGGADALARRGARLIAVSADFDYPTARDFLERRGLERLPFLLDERARMVKKVAPGIAFPSTIVVDARTGAVLGAFSEIDWRAETVARTLDDLVAARP